MLRFAFDERITTKFNKVFFIFVPYFQTWIWMDDFDASLVRYTIHLLRLINAVIYKLCVF